MTVTNCQKGVCKLRKKTEVDIMIKFNPGKPNKKSYFSTKIQEII